ncbi:MAG: hypothetical protein GSR73_02655, partial [Desulfurococcales archaeon]|nr:hypothetical protein [Desulfurococcales archaeon]
MGDETIVLGWIIHYYAHKKRKEKEKEIEKQIEERLREEEERRGPLPEEERAMFREAEKFRAILDAILEENPKLRNEIEKIKEEVKDPLIKGYIEELTHLDDASPAFKGTVTILYQAIKQAVEKGLHKDREKFFNYIASTLLHTAHELAKQTPHLTEEYIKQKYGENVAYTFHDLTDPTTAIHIYLSRRLEELKEKVKEAEEYYERYRELFMKISDLKDKMGIERWNQSPTLAYTGLISELRGTPHEEVLKKPEEILGIKPEELGGEESITGGVEGPGGSSLDERIGRLEER